MKMCIKITAATVILTGLGVAAATANEPYFPKREKSFGRLDANKDGQVNLAEYAPVLQRNFTRMDLNGDKAVTAAEIEQRMTEAVARRRDRIMQLLDQDKNGTITASELDKVAEAMFKGADTDHNGNLTLAEMQGFKRGEWRRNLVGQGAN